MFRSCWNSESPGNKACLLTISAAQTNKYNYTPSYIEKEKYQNHQHKMNRDDNMSLPHKMNQFAPTQAPLI